MFSHGDSNVPLEHCQKFVLETVQAQMLMLVENARKMSEERGLRSFGYLEVVFAFRRHPILLKRLVNYIRALEIASNLSHSCEPVDVDTPVATEVDGEILAPTSSSSAASAEHRQPDEKFSKSLLTAIRQFDVLGNLLAGYDSSTNTFAQSNDHKWLDQTKMERLRQIALRAQDMDAESYKHLAEARQQSLCSSKGQRSPAYCKNFARWLALPRSPPAELGVLYMLNFCVSEIVAILVESAQLVREEQERQLHANGSSNFNSNADPLRPIELNCYEEALRRNRGWAKRKDILFGNF